VQGKRYQLVVLVGEALQRGRPVLIGTGSVEESEDLARWMGGWLWWVEGGGLR
jgi:preprotein translocase subunit SecA